MIQEIKEMFNARRPLLLVALLCAVVVGSIAGVATVKNGRHTPVVLAAEKVAPVDRAGIETSFAPVVKRDIPAVVNVSSSRVVKTSENMPDQFFSDPFFRQFFGDQMPRRNRPQAQRERALGSGVIVNSEGYILTNNHVVDGATEIKVALGDKREFTAKVIGRDPKTDIAVLKVDAKNLPTIPLGDSSKMEVGDLVLAMGNPFGLNQTVTMGIVSAMGRGGLGIEDYEDFIQTDAAINHGNSGGALVNSRGELIGINTAILSDASGGNQGVGFAVPINMARQVMDQILKNGKVVRGYLGAYIQDVTPELAKQFSVTESRGALLSDVTEGGPAAKAGLKVGDVVVAMNGQTVTDMRSFRLNVAMANPGTTVHLKVVRNGHDMEVPVTLGELPNSPSGEEGGSSEGSGSALDGVNVDNLTPQIARQLGLSGRISGVVVTSISDASRAADAGLRRGDVIQEVNRKPVANVSDFQKAVGRAGNQPVLLLVNRDGNTLFVVVDSH